MTMVDAVPDKILFSRMTVKEWLDASPGILVIARTPANALELYSYHDGQRVSFVPASPQELWDWLQWYSTSHFDALVGIGYNPRENPQLPPASPPKRTKVNLTDDDLKDLFS